jgi:integrase
MPTPILKPDDNGTFYAHWSENRRSKRRSMGTKSRAEAETRFARWLLLGGHKGDQITEEAQKLLTTAELWAIYDQKHVQTETSSSGNIGNAWNNLKVYFGPLTPSEIDQEKADEYEERRAAGVIGRPSKSATVRKELVLLRACFNWHASAERGKKRLLDVKDVPAYVLPAESDPRDRWLRTDEIARVLEAAKLLHPGEPRMSRGERFLWLALETAARKQAILDLTWDRVDFEIGTIDFHDPARRRTKKKRVVVPISKTLLPVLKRMHKERINDLVMDNKGAVWATIQSIVNRSGIVPPTPKRKHNQKPLSTGISPHTFRHTAATHMARRGVPLYDIAGILGNSLAMVEKVYAKHCPDRLRAAVNSISSVMLEAAE